MIIKIIDFIKNIISKTFFCISVVIMTLSIAVFFISVITRPRKKETMTDSFEFFKRFFDNLREFTEKEKARKEEQNNVGD